MSLSLQQKRATVRELRENFERAGITAEEACHDLHITPRALDAIMNLHADALEDPWILRDYLSEKVTERGGEPVAFTALMGDPADYWFLDARAIRARLIATSR